MNSVFFCLKILMPVGVKASNSARLEIGFDIKDVSRLLDAGISKKTPVSKSALNNSDS